jgi:hypothetical protein
MDPLLTCAFAGPTLKLAKAKAKNTTRAKETPFTARFISFAPVNFVENAKLGGPPQVHKKEMQGAFQSMTYVVLR